LFYASSTILSCCIETLTIARKDYQSSLRRKGVSTVYKHTVRTCMSCFFCDNVSTHYAFHIAELQAHIGKFTEFNGKACICEQ
jgi:hypothetical protein